MKPTIKTTPGRIVFSWSDTKLRITVRRAKMDSHGKVSGELLIEIDNPEEGLSPYMDEIRIPDFLSEQSLTRQVNAFSRKYEGIEWDEVFMAIKFHVLDYVRSGEPVQELWSSDDIKAPEYLIWPFFPKHQPTIIFGEKGTLKSQTALIFYIAFTLPWWDNELGFRVPDMPQVGLYLDWETDANEVQWRMKCLCEGMELGAIGVRYRRMVHPLAQDLDQVQARIEEIGATVLIVDSLAGAVGGDVNKTELASEFFAAVRELGLTTIVIGQTSKKEDGKKTVLGSTLFHYYARSIWEIRRESEGSDEEDYADVALFHRAANMSRLHEPIGLRVTYNGTKTRVELSDVRSMPELLESLKLSVRITEALKSGAKTSKELASICSAQEATISRACRRMRSKGKVVPLDDGKLWGLMAAS